MMKPYYGIAAAVIAALLAAGLIARQFVDITINSKLDQARNDVFSNIANTRRGVWVCDEHDTIKDLIEGKRPAVPDDHCQRQNERLLIRILEDRPDGYVRFSSSLPTDMWTSRYSLQR